MSDPHDELHLAAARIRDIASKATPGPWMSASSNRRRDGVALVGAVANRGTGKPIAVLADVDVPTRHADAEHIALFDPVIAEHIVAVLTEEALYHYSARPAIVALAKAINGGAA